MSSPDTILWRLRLWLLLRLGFRRGLQFGAGEDDGFGSGDAASFMHGDHLIGAYITDPVHLSARPDDFDAEGFVVRWFAEAEGYG